jgi:hypothetical protein
LACLVISLTPDAEDFSKEYQMSIVSANSTMDAHNQLVSPKNITYTPFAKDTVTVDDLEYGTLPGLQYGISTLRLMQNTDCRLVFENKSEGQKVFDVSLPHYIGMIGSLYTKMNRPLTVQEYLDREDFYTIVFFISGNQLIQLQVNSWRLRTTNHLKL